MEQLDVDRARALVGQGALLLDVREDAEWAVGHARGATHLPMGQVPAHLDQLPADRTIVVVCRSGARSDRVAQWLSHQGRDAHNLAGGMQAWAAAGQAVVTDDGSPGGVA